MSETSSRDPGLTGDGSAAKVSKVSYADELLDTIANAKKMGGKDRLVAGNHRLAVLSFTRKKNQKAGKSGQYRLNVDFEVQASDIYKPGTKASISFFVERPEYPEYEHDRAKSFIDACAACLSDTRGTAALGGEMMSDAQRGRGIVLDIQVTPDLHEDGTPKKGPKGNIYTSETWVPIQQTWEQVAEARTALDQVHGQFKPEGGQGRASVQQQAAPQQNQTQAPAGSAFVAGQGTGGSSLLRRGG